MTHQSADCEAYFNDAIRGDCSEESYDRLLTCFQAGHLPIERVIELAMSPRDELAEMGTWIASEVPRRARAIAEQLAGLARHSSHRVRCHIIDVLSGGASERYIPTVIEAVRDPHVAVRCRALEHIARWPAERVMAAFPAPLAAIVLDESFKGTPTWGTRTAGPATEADEVAALLALVPAIRSQNRFESIAIRFMGSRFPLAAETARVLLNDPA